MHVVVGGTGIGGPAPSSPLHEGNATCACSRPWPRSDGSVSVSTTAAHEAGRLPKTASVVRSSRQSSAERFMQLAHGCAPDDFERIEHVFAEGELHEIAGRHKVLTGLVQASESARG